MQKVPFVWISEDRKIIINSLPQSNIIGAIISYILGVFLVPFVIAFSKKEGLVDVPNERKIHKVPISRLGGVAIWASTMLTFLFLVLLSYYPYGSLVSGILLGSSLIFLLGLVDDVYNLDAKFKLVVQILITTVVYLLGVKVDMTSFSSHMGLAFDLGFLSYPITLLWIVGISNAVNFIDGVDGLAGSVITVNAITLAIVALAMRPPNSISALIAFILAGSMLAFLTYNFNPAKIFMGDVGSLAIGAGLGVISVITKNEFLLLICGAIFVAEAISVMLQIYSIRVRGKKIFKMAPLHHHFELKGWSEQTVVIRFWIISIILALIALSSLKIR